MSRFSWRWWPRNKNKSRDDAELSSKRFEGGDRRRSAPGAIRDQPAAAQPWRRCHEPPKRRRGDLPPPKRALTGRDEAGSRCSSPEVTPRVVAIDANPGLTFYELYMTEGVPRLTGLEPDPMLKGTKAFPGPGGTMFRLISYPPKRPEGWKPPPGVTLEEEAWEMSDKGPWHGRSFRPRRARYAHIGYHRLWDRGSWRDDAGTGRRTEGPFAPRRLHRAKRNPTSLAQPVAGALSHGLHRLAGSAAKTWAPSDEVNPGLHGALGLQAFIVPGSFFAVASVGCGR